MWRIIFTGAMLVGCVGGALAQPAPARTKLCFLKSGPAAGTAIDFEAQGAQAVRPGTPCGDGRGSKGVAFVLLPAPARPDPAAAGQARPSTQGPQTDQGQRRHSRSFSRPSLVDEPGLVEETPWGFCAPPCTSR